MIKEKERLFETISKIKSDLTRLDSIISNQNNIIREQNESIQLLLKSQADNKSMECMVFIPYRGNPVVIKDGVVVNTDHAASFDVDWNRGEKVELTIREY